MILCSFSTHFAAFNSAKCPLSQRYISFPVSSYNLVLISRIRDWSLLYFFIGLYTPFLGYCKSSNSSLCLRFRRCCNSVSVDGVGGKYIGVPFIEKV
jgi:hypothetical protein